MKVQVTQAFRFAPDGNHTITVETGTVVEGRCAEVALKAGWGVELRAPEPPPAAEPKADEPEEKAIEAAPQNKATPRAPWNKRK